MGDASPIPEEEDKKFEEARLLRLAADGFKRALRRSRCPKFAARDANPIPEEEDKKFLEALQEEEDRLMRQVAARFKENLKQLKDRCEAEQKAIRDAFGLQRSKGGHFRSVEEYLGADEKTIIRPIGDDTRN